jgi:DNA end-binding protein Ku
MPRSIWNGAVAFGAVVVPVKLYAATDPQSLAMRELHARDEAPIAHRLVDPDTGEEVPREQVARGVEVGPGEWVLLSQEEIRAAEKPRRRAVEIEAFVPDEQIDPMFYDRTYNLAPRDGGEEGYAVLLAALRQTGRSGIGRVVLRSREQLVTVRAGERALRMHTMHFGDEVVTGKSVRVPAAARKPSRAELELADTLIERLQTQFDPESLRHGYRERVLRMARRKARGQKVKLPAREPARKAPDDLVAALRASVEKVAA